MNSRSIELVPDDSNAKKLDRIHKVICAEGVKYVIYGTVKKVDLDRVRYPIIWKDPHGHLSKKLNVSGSSR